MKEILPKTISFLIQTSSCMPTKTVVEREKATPKTTPKRTPTQAEIQASIDRLDADMERWGKGRKYTLAEVEKRLGL
ncbi:hypothetical protein [Methanoculleus sp. UBA430]|uniref:hypothetical protein n=2 Tax=unclassified Methanoculleus TaxID=2619537 RepID=UPI0025ECFC06|nr:hypothetical protein [Methanoculleus sp. UBA430]